MTSPLVIMLCAASMASLTGCGSEVVGVGKRAAEPVEAEQRPVPARELSEVPSISRGAVLLVRVRPGPSVLLRSRPRGRVIARVSARTRFGSAMTMPVLERRGAHWLGVATEAVRGGSLGWIQADPDRLDYTQTALSLHADISRRSLELRDGGRVRRRIDVTVGKPSTPTPSGRFAVTDKINRGLAKAYGCCALALTGHQAHLPEGWPGGDRIAIHGTLPGTPAGRAASAGCLRARNGELRRLIAEVPLGTPVYVRQ